MMKTLETCMTITPTKINTPQTKQKEIQMGKTKRFVLKDRKHKPRVIIEAIEYVTDSGHPDVAIGMAIRSDDDEHDITIGTRLAHARAVRAIKGRRPCIVSRTEAVKNIWALQFDDFRYLMQLTGGCVSDFAKGECGFYDSIFQMMKNINFKKGGC